MGLFAQHFSQPRGPLGWLAGTIMSVENRERNAFAISQLDVLPGHHVLEIGFGPGVAIGKLAALVGDGVVMGVDIAAVLVDQARRRNAEWIRCGRVSLRLGSADDLSFPDDSFDRALAVNSFHHWPDSHTGLTEIRRVLKPGGLLVIAEQPVWAPRDADDLAIGRQLAGTIAAAGFERLEVVAQRMRSAPTICVRAFAPTIPAAGA